jgi:hypothetical protein
MLSSFIVFFIVGCAKEEAKKAKGVPQQEETSGIVSVEGAELHYVIEGKGTPWNRVGILRIICLMLFSKIMTSPKDPVRLRHRFFLQLLATIIYGLTSSGMTEKTFCQTSPTISSRKAVISR